MRPITFIIRSNPRADVSAELDGFEDQIRSTLGITFIVHLSRGRLKLDSIIVPKERRSEGLGTRALEALCSFADRHGLVIVLTPGLPDDRHGTTSRARLVKFYKRFGFVENKGRNKDFSISEGMIRAPR